MRFTRLDVMAPDLVGLIARRPPDVVYHLAGPPGASDPVVEARAVVGGAVAVLEAARLGGAAKVVVAVSSAIYGDPDALPVKETHPSRPVDGRGVAELAVAGYLALYRDRHNLEGTTLVLADVYGPRQAAGPIVSWAAALRAGEVSVAVGGPHVAGDLLYVDDAVDALARAAERGGGLVLNVGSGQATEARELHAAVAAAVGVDGPLVAAPATGDRAGRMALDPGRSRLHLGWSPFTPLADGVAATVAAGPQP